MDFQNMKRRQLQSLCKLNNIPANLTNAAMATALSNLPTVEGLEEFLRDPTAGDFGSPDVSRTTTHRKVTIEEPEGSNVTTRTRGARRPTVEATETRKTPATRTTRKKKSEDSTAQKWDEKHLQADFEADLEQSEVSDNSGLLGGSMEISGDVSAVSMDDNAQLPLESQNETEEVVHEIVNDVVFDVDDNSKNPENNAVVTKDEEEHRKVDFHSLNRRDLQGLCKRNKIPANTSNATMADALASLEIVEGLEEFLEEHNSQAPHSPTVSEMTSSCARRTWTSRRVPKEPASSKLITKSCRGSRRKVIEEIDQENTSAVSQASEAGTIVCSEVSVHKKELQTYCRRVTVASAGKPSGNIECSVNIISDEGRLSVLGGAEIVNPKVLDFVDTSNGFTQKAEAMNNFDGSLQNVDSSEGDNGILATKNAELLDDSENKKDAGVDHISIGGSEISEQLLDMVNEIAFIESKDSQLENVDGTTNAKSSEGSEVSENGSLSDAGSENGSENSEFENVHEGTNTGDLDTEVFTDAGLFNGNASTNAESSEGSEVSANGSLSDAVSENGSENSEFENVHDGTNTGGLDSEVFTDAGSKCEHADEVSNTEVEQHVINSVVASSHFVAQRSPVEKTENNHAEEEHTSRDDALLSSDLNEKVEASYVEHEKSTDVYSETTIQTDDCGAKGKATPLMNKSMRKLKIMLKKKLEERNALPKKLENLSLEDKDDSLAKVEEDRDDESEDLEGVRAEDLEDLIESIDVTLGDNFDGKDLQVNCDANAVNLYPVDTILDNSISEDAVRGDINVEVDQELTSENHSSNTPSKTMMPLVSSLSKTPVSVARMNHASDVNKENIDHSASKTKSTKDILSPMSMRKLKKAIVGIQQQQHSEKKRRPLSENCLPLASP